MRPLKTRTGPALKVGGIAAKPRCPVHHSACWPDRLSAQLSSGGSRTVTRCGYGYGWHLTAPATRTGGDT